MNQLLKLKKYSGAGNTFVVSSSEIFSDNEFASLKFRKMVQNICSGENGPGSDGMLILTKTSPANYRWNFYNSDGSSAEMCGNASRCAALFCHEEYSENDVNFETVAGPVRVKALESNVFQTTMPSAVTISENIIIEIVDEKVEIFYCNTGVPHAVVFCKSEEERLRLFKIASQIRHHSSWNPTGANATFLWVNADGGYNAVTFERGVEAFTQACGTGAVAAALMVQNTSGQNQILIEMPGGQLHVDLSDKNGPLLIGPAIKIGDFEFWRK